MPTVLLIDGFRFFFYSDECQEPAHIHVVAAEKEAKYWLNPIELVWSDGFRSGELKTIEEHIINNLDLLQEAWDVFFKTK